MARVAVLHNTLDLRGGADAVCLHVCEALQDDHDVTLYTLGRSSPSDLNGLFGTAAGVPVHRPPGTALVSRGLDALARWVGPGLPARSVLLQRVFRGAADAYDLAVSTANEFALPIPSVQYVHFPQFNRGRTDVGPNGWGNTVWTRLAGLGNGSLPADTKLLANSAWTADVVEGIYGQRPSVCHPPVDPIPNTRDWPEREPGIVTLGRVAPDNRTLDAIRILDGLRSRGHDLHLHVVGSAAPAYADYVRRVSRAADERASVTLETDVSRSRVERLLATHRYGLNTKPNEHFGMAVAEFVAAGMLAFAPDNGGQREVLAQDDDLLFDTPDEAIETIHRAIENDRRPTLDRDRFGSDRFARRIQSAVAEQVAATEG